MFDNLLGNKDQTYWPPIVAIVQSLNFTLFGLNPLSMMLQSVYMTVLLILACFCCLRTLKYSVTESAVCRTELLVPPHGKLDTYLFLFFLCASTNTTKSKLYMVEDNLYTRSWSLYWLRSHFILSSVSIFAISLFGRFSL